MSILQEPPSPPLPVICDFFFEQTGPPGIATYDGDLYPYPPLPSDKGSDYRYAWGTTPVFLAVEFFGIAHEIEHKVQSHVIAPPGVSILEYFWDFGDGHTGHGPIVTHTYSVPDPTTSISLTVLDSLGREFSTSKALSLVIVDFGYVYQRIRGNNTETPPKRQEVEGSGDFALSIEGTPTRVWVARGGKPVREETEKALSGDRAYARTHFYRSARDTALTSDSVSRTRGLFRHTTDPNRIFLPLPLPAAEITGVGQWRQRLLAIIAPTMPYPEPEPFYRVDRAIQNTHRYAEVKEASKAVDKATFVYYRPLAAALSFVGRLPRNVKRTLKATLTPLGKSPH